jgi:branched-chain amino acid transport system substrate-binding protein
MKVTASKLNALAFTTTLGMLGSANIAHALDIAIVDALTGSAAVSGIADVCGAKIAVEVVNARGGVNGEPLTLRVADNQSNPAFAAQAASNLTEEGVKFFVGGSISSTVLSMLPIIADEGGLHTGGTTKAAEILSSGALVYRLNSDNSQDGASIAEYVSSTLGAKRIAYVSLQGAYGEGALKAIQDSLASDVEIVNTYFAPAETTNFQSIVTSLNADNPDAVIFAIFGNAQPVAFMRAYKQGGPDAQLLAAAGVLTESIAQSAGGAADGVISADLWLAGIESAANDALKQEYEARKDSIPECSSSPLDKQVAVTYAQVDLLAQGIDKAQSTDVETVHKMILEGSWQLPQGTVTFREDGQAIVEYHMIVGEGGTVAPLGR